MNDTSVQVRKSPDASQLDKLLRMLRSTSRRFPRTRLLTTVDGFGASLDDGRSLHIVYSGRWSEADLRDFLALFATWLVTDPRRLRVAGIPLAGALQQEVAE
jgi:hypothetical protein